MPRACQLALLAVMMTGCGSRPQADYSSLGLVDVSGTIRLDGEPVAGAVVAFRDVESGGEAYGLTDDSGYYRLHFDSVEFGVLPGQKQVSVSTTRRVLGLNSESEGGDSEDTEDDEGEALQYPVTELIPDAYRGDSVLRVTVTENTTEFNFDLAGDGSTTTSE